MASAFCLVAVILGTASALRGMMWLYKLNLLIFAANFLLAWWNYRKAER